MVLITYAQTAPKWPAGYERTLYVPDTLRYHVRASSEEKYHLLAFTFKTVIHSRSDEKIIILQVGCNTGKKSIYIAQFQHIYHFFFYKLYIIQHLDGCASTQLNLWMYFLTICGGSISTPQYVLHQHYH